MSSWSSRANTSAVGPSNAFSPAPAARVDLCLLGLSGDSNGDERKLSGSTGGTRSGGTVSLSSCSCVGDRRALANPSTACDSAPAAPVPSVPPLAAEAAGPSSRAAMQLVRKVVALFSTSMRGDINVVSALSRRYPGRRCCRSGVAAPSGAHTYTYTYTHSPRARPPGRAPRSRPTRRRCVYAYIFCSTPVEYPGQARGNRLLTWLLTSVRAGRRAVCTSHTALCDTSMISLIHM